LRDLQRIGMDEWIALIERRIAEKAPPREASLA
jgi:hypothetical protein